MEELRGVVAAGRVGAAAVGWSWGCPMAIREVKIANAVVVQIAYVLIALRLVSKPARIISV